MRRLMFLILLVLGLTGPATGATRPTDAAEPSPGKVPQSASESPGSECSSGYPLRAPSSFWIALDDAVCDTPGEGVGWIQGLYAGNYRTGHPHFEKHASRLENQEYDDADAVALQAATRELASRLVRGQVRAVDGHEVWRVPFGYNDEESTTSVQGMFVYSEADDLPQEIRDLAHKVSASGWYPQPHAGEDTPLDRRPLPFMAYLRVYETAENHGNSKWVKVLDITIHDHGQDDRFRKPGRPEHLAFLTSVDQRTFKLAVKELARRIVDDDLEGMRGDKQADAVMQIGYDHLNVSISAAFKYSSKEDVATGLRKILAAVKQDASGNDNANQTPPEVF